MKRPLRKAIPRAVKVAVLERQKSRCTECGELLRDGMRRVEFDHRPSIIMRAVNVEGTDYHPPQNDPDHIEALHKGCHLKRTVGRLPDAAKTVTTKGSDSWLAAKFRKIEGKNKPRRKAKIANRGFDKGKRKFGQ